MTTENRVPKQLTPWKPGQSGNPAGRPKGSRNKLAEACINDLYESWLENGAAAIKKMREERPHEYVKAVVSILPKEVKIEHIDDMTDDQLTKRIRQLASDLGVAVGLIEGNVQASGGTEAAEGSDQAIPLPTLQ